MDWSSPFGVGVVGVGGVLTLMLAIWIGNVVMNFLGEDEVRPAASPGDSK